MAMQSGGAGKDGLIQSSIALLQERFRQLQREKEMRQTRQLLRSCTNKTFMSSSSSSLSSSSSDSESGNFYLNNNDNQFKLLFPDEVAVVQRPELSLSLWPTGQSENYNGGRNAAAVMKQEDKLYSSYNGLSGWDVKRDDSRVSDVDTSLHL